MNETVSCEKIKKAKRNDLLESNNLINSPVFSSILIKFANSEARDKFTTLKKRQPIYHNIPGVANNTNRLTCRSHVTKFN